MQWYYEIDRLVAVIKPKEAFLTWVNQVTANEFDLSLAQLRTDCTSLLIPAFPEPEMAMGYIGEKCTDIFALELGAWEPDETQWPAVRDVATFWAWFDVEFHSTVIDMADPHQPDTDTDAEVADDDDA